MPQPLITAVLTIEDAVGKEVVSLMPYKDASSQKHIKKSVNTVLKTTYETHKPKFTDRDENGMTALMHAAAKKTPLHEYALEWILKQYSDTFTPNVKDIDCYDHAGKTAFCHAVAIPDSKEEGYNDADKQTISQRMLQLLVKAGATEDLWLPSNKGYSNHAIIQATATRNLAYLTEEKILAFILELAAYQGVAPIQSLAPIKRFVLGILPRAIEHSSDTVELWLKTFKLYIRELKKEDADDITLTTFDKAMDHETKMKFMLHLPTIHFILSTQTLQDLLNDSVTTSWGKKEKDILIEILAKRTPKQKLKTNSHALIEEIKSQGTKIHERRDEQQTEEEIKRTVYNSLNAIDEEKLPALTTQDHLTFQTALDYAAKFENDYAALWIVEKAIIENTRISIPSRLVDYPDNDTDEPQLEEKNPNSDNTPEYKQHTMKRKRFRPVVNSITSELIAKLSDREVHVLLVAATKAGNLRFLKQNMKAYLSRLKASKGEHTFAPWIFMREIIPAATVGGQAITQFWLDNYLLPLMQTRALFPIYYKEQIGHVDAYINDVKQMQQELKTFFTFMSSNPNTLQTIHDLTSKHNHFANGIYEYLGHAVCNDWEYQSIQLMVQLLKDRKDIRTKKFNLIISPYNFNTSGTTTTVEELFTQFISHSCSIEIIILFITHFETIHFDLNKSTSLPNLTGSIPQRCRDPKSQVQIKILFQLLDTISRTTPLLEITPEIASLINRLNPSIRQEIHKIKIVNKEKMVVITEHIEQLNEQKISAPINNNAPPPGYDHSIAIPLSSEPIPEVVKPSVLATTLSSAPISLVPPYNPESLVNAPIEEPIPAVQPKIIEAKTTPKSHTNTRSTTQSLAWCAKQFDDLPNYHRNPRLQALNKKYAAIEMIRTLYQDETTERIASCLPDEELNSNKFSGFKFFTPAVNTNLDAKQEPTEMQKCFQQLEILSLFRKDPELTERIKLFTVNEIITALYGDKIAGMVSNELIKKPNVGVASTL